PQLINGESSSWLANEDPIAGSIRIASNLNSSVLAIQGPPGSGKTYTGARMIIDLHRQGKKIGITAVSHKVIRKLTESTIEICRQENTSIFFVHKIDNSKVDLPPEISEIDDSDKVRTEINNNKIGCGTAWFWAEDKSQGILDYLFIDEAGQMSLAYVLAASRAAKNLILLGDPQQLEQPQKGAHPEGSDVAALTYLLDGNLTMPKDKGLFLETTRRLHPSICKFTSEIFYDNRLKSLAGLENQVITCIDQIEGSGLLYIPIEHTGNQNRSLEEIYVIVALVNRLLDGGKWTDEKAQSHFLQKTDIMIIAPFNSQVSALRERLPGLSIGTVDKFQGQEAPVVIYSMTSSSPEDAPRGMGFLYNPNRLNVATSRAKCLSIIVAAPKLFNPECHSIEQMKWANALCRYIELAKTVVPEDLI
ncbi:MAG: DEAD/DEAH box helicase, partial [Saprospiraceae bacterium]